ncbi:ATP-binding protein [Plebeiibacterium sediminum]|uniref:histidine kinase n=1 Tax=Plebeiibacterium sediminum TaxID=2992112 RepID=A0AAE3M781_9BACT|nr:ATP-binding protein [Plebeiobacterium sediminum]MCW3788302.1 ATP-binding protein [Plebeiobacterium sediminum]
MDGLRALKDLRDDVVNKALVIGFGFGVISYLVTVVRAFSYGFNWTLYAITLVVVYLGILVYYRKKVKLGFKVLSVAFIILMALITGLSKYGFLVSSKAYIILIPIFVSFVMGYRRAILLLIFFSFIYALFGVLFVYEIIPYTIDVRAYILSPISWAMDITIIILTAAALLVVGKKYSDSILLNLALIKQQNKELNERERKFYLLFDHSFDAILIVKDGFIVDVNTIATKVLKVGKDEIVGMHIEDFAPEKQPDGTVSALKMREFADEVRANKSKSFEWRHQRYNGEEFDAEVHIAVIDVEENELFQVLIKDITEQKQQQSEIEKYRLHLENLVEKRTEALNQANQDLLNSNNQLRKQHAKLEKSIAEIKSMQEKLIEKEKMASLGVMTSGVAHEINNPLNFIQTGLYSLRNTFDTDLQKYLSQDDLTTNRQVIDYMEEGVNRISSIVNSLGSFSSKGTAGFTVCNINDVIEDCLVVLSHEIKNRIEIVKDFSASKIEVMASEDGLHQVFFSILYNSVQAIKHDGVITIKLSVDENNNVIVFVRDNGMGMSKVTMKKMFDPFYTKKSPGEGSGLGMTIVYNIVKEHGGRVKVDSKLGEGTLIEVVLPILA